MVVEDLHLKNLMHPNVHIHLQYEMWTEEWKNAHQTKQKKSILCIKEMYRNIRTIEWDGVI